MKSTSIERLLALRAFPGLQEVSPESVLPMARYAKDRWFRPQETILREGAPVRHMHFVLEGSVEITREGTPFRKIGPAESFGALAALARVEQGVTAVALEKTHTLELSIENLELVFLEHFELMLACLQAISGAAVRERRQLPDAGYNPVEDEGQYPVGRLSFIDRMVAFNQSLVFENYRIDALTHLSRFSEELRFEPGDVLWEVGTRSPNVLHMVAGRVRCESPEGKVFEFGPGGFLGSLDALNSRVNGRWYSAKAVSPTVALGFHIGDFVDMMEDHSYLALELLRGVSEDLFQVLGRRKRYATDDSLL